MNPPYSVQRAMMRDAMRKPVVISFPIVAPTCPDDSPLMGAWKLANQKWDLGRQACRVAREAEAIQRPHSVVIAAERKMAFAEEECARAVELLFDEYRNEMQREMLLERSA